MWRHKLKFSVNTDILYVIYLVIFDLFWHIDACTREGSVYCWSTKDFWQWCYSVSIKYVFNNYFFDLFLWLFYFFNRKQLITQTYPVWSTWILYCTELFSPCSRELNQALSRSISLCLFFCKLETLRSEASINTWVASWLNRAVYVEVGYCRIFKT